MTREIKAKICVIVIAVGLRDISKSLKGLLAALLLAVLMAGCGPSKEFHSMALHELGHVAGRTHLNDPSSIMYPFVEAGKRLSPTDLAMAEASTPLYVCFSAATLPAYFHDRLVQAVQEWNDAARLEWLVLGTECSSTVMFGSDTHMHAAYTHPGYPVRIVFNWHVEWF